MKNTHSCDMLLGGKLVLRQPVKGFRVAIDPVFLAASVSANKGAKVLELGCGTGAAALCLASRVLSCRVTGIEIQRDISEIAKINVRDNGLMSRVSITWGDINNPPINIVRQCFDHVMVNPPFNAKGHGTLPTNYSREKSMVEDLTRIEPWVILSRKALKNKGTLNLIYNVENLEKALSVICQYFGHIKIFPLWPRRDMRSKGKRVIISAKKGSKAPLELMAGLVLHNDDGSFTKEAEAILRNAKALEF